MLEIDLKKNYRDLIIDLNLQIESKGLHFIFGPSGSGKTTLLKTIAGFSSDSTSTVKFDDKSWQEGPHGVNISAHKRNCCLVFQEPRLFDHLSVKENLYYSYKRRENRDKSLDFDDVVNQTKVDELLNLFPHELSGGQKQMVCFARALLNDPTLLLLDEPFSAIDAQARTRYYKIIQSFSQMEGKTVLIISHNFNEIVPIADSLTYLKKGRTVCSGPMQQSIEILNDEMSKENLPSSLLTGQSKEYDKGYGLQCVNIGHQDIFVLHPSGLKADEIFPIHIYAKDVSISKDRPKSSSILNILECRFIDSERKENNSRLLKLAVSDQFLFALITAKSFDQLALKNNDVVFAQIKSMSLLNLN